MENFIKRFLIVTLSVLCVVNSFEKAIAGTSAVYVCDEYHTNCQYVYVTTYDNNNNNINNYPNNYSNGFNTNNNTNVYVPNVSAPVHNVSGY